MVERRPLSSVLLLAGVFLLCSAASLQVGAVAPAADSNDLESSIGGDAYATEQDGQRYAWVGQDDPLEVTVDEYELPGNETTNVELCLESATSDASWTDRSCTVPEMENDSSVVPESTLSLDLDDRFETGDLELEVSLHRVPCTDDCDSNCDTDCDSECDADCETDCGEDCETEQIVSTEQIASTEHSVHLLDPADDLDGDGLSNEDEVAAGASITVADTDGDGLEDGPEVEEHGTDPTSSDTDGDGLDDDAEVNSWDSEATTADTDGDGLEDAAEIEEYGSDPTDPHSDDDGLDDGTEAHEHGTNPTKTDTDGDGIGDGIEVDRSTDPTDPNDPGDGNQSSAAETAEPAPAEASESNSGDEVQRGFFSNGDDASGTSLLSETDLTVLGFLLSLLSVIVPLVTEG